MAFELELRFFFADLFPTFRGRFNSLRWEKKQPDVELLLSFSGIFFINNYETCHVQSKCLSLPLSVII